MNKLSVVPESHQLEVNSVVPRVAMDTSLSELGKVINFDYEAFQETNRRLGGKEDNSDLTIHIHPLGVNAYYDSYGATIHLTNKDTTKKRKINKQLRHELQHHIDFSETPPTRRQHLQQKIGGKVASMPVLLWPGILGLSPPGIFAGMRVGMDDVPVHEAINTFTVAPSLGSAALSVALGLYYFQKPERRARRAERQKLPPIITTTKR